MASCIASSNKEIDCVSCGYLLHSKHKTSVVEPRYSEKQVYYSPEIKDIILEDFRYRNSTSPCLNQVWGKLYKSQVIKEHNIRFPEEWKYAEDINFNVQFYLVMENIVFCKQPLYHYCTYNSSLSSGYRLGSYKFEVTFRDFLENSLCQVIGSTYYNDSGYLSMIEKAEKHSARILLSGVTKNQKKLYLREIFDDKRYRDSIKTVDQSLLCKRRKLEKECIDNDEFSKWYKLMLPYSFNYKAKNIKIKVKRATNLLFAHFKKI